MYILNNTLTGFSVFKMKTFDLFLSEIDEPAASSSLNIYGTVKNNDKQCHYLFGLVYSRGLSSIIKIRVSDFSFVGFLANPVQKYPKVFGKGKFKQTHRHYTHTNGLI